MPRLIDCSIVYGDNVWNESQYEEIDKDIALLELQIKSIDDKMYQTQNDAVQFFALNSESTALKNTIQP